MIAIFHDMIEETMEVFMDDFSVFGDSFSSCLSHLDKMLKRCEDANLVLNWEKCHFMVKEGIVLGHKISKSRIKFDKAKVDVIAKLPHPTSVKGIQSFLGHAEFYCRFIQDFSKITRPMTHLLEKDTPFIFSKECVESFNILKKKLTEAPILVSPDWDLPFEIMCDASDFTMVKTQEKLDKDEILCARSIFCMQGDISKVVFDDGKGPIANRKEMQSLATGITIQKQIIDTFVTVLSYEERIRSGGKDKRIHYFPTNDVVTHLLNKEKDEAKEYVSFENMINNQMNTSESKKKMKDVSYAFFPVVAEGQYYVIVFNLLKANAEILDNEKDYDYNKYQEVFDSVHPCVDKLTKEKPAKVLKLKWKTKNNKIDSGLYTMMHMELYQGESATKWKTDIVEENNRDYLTQMTNMRMRYTTKILMHEMNTKRGLMSEYANKFGEDNKEEEKVKKMVEDAIKKRIAEGA
ncbi:reverse transcriptase domain-containing protein [Tanacetum coccineum]